MAMMSLPYMKYQHSALTRTTGVWWWLIYGATPILTSSTPLISIAQAAKDEAARTPNAQVVVTVIRRQDTEVLTPDTACEHSRPIAIQ